MYHSNCCFIGNVCLVTRPLRLTVMALPNFSGQECAIASSIWCLRWLISTCICENNCNLDSCSQQLDGTVHFACEAILLKLQSSCCPVIAGVAHMAECDKGLIITRVEAMHVAAL